MEQEERQKPEFAAWIRSLRERVSDPEPDEEDREWTPLNAFDVSKTMFGAPGPRTKEDGVKLRH